MLEVLAQTYDVAAPYSTAEAGGLLGLAIGTFFFGLAIYVVAVIALWKVFEKAGIPGWKAIIPIYNSWLFFQMAGKPGWWAFIPLAGIIPILGFFAGIASIVLYILAALEVGKAFGKSDVFTIVGLIIFSIVGLLIIGFDDSKYKKPATAPATFA